MRWEPLEEADLGHADLIQRTIHADLPERPAVMAERRRLYPAGCRKLVRDGTMVGYAVAHPWRQGRVPPLDTLLRTLPARPDCLHLHEVAILPVGGGAGAAGIYANDLRDLASAAGLAALACVSVYGTAPLWMRHGFAAAEPQPHPDALRSYGSGAVYMLALVTA